MDYSLLSKFRGAWLGSCLAANIKEQNLVTIEGYSLSDEIRLDKTVEQDVAKISEERLCELVQRQWRSLNNYWDNNSDLEALEPSLFPPQLKVCELALLVLPTILFYHDYWQYLESCLHSQADKYQLSPTSRDYLLIWAYTIRLGIRGELTQPNLTAKILQETNIPDSSTSECLSSIELLCRQGHGLQKLLENCLDQGEVVMSSSLFYFFGNLSDFRLSTQQGSELVESQQIMLAALGGALSGAYNGLSIIPSSWRNSCQKKRYYQYIISKTKDIMREWSGSDCSREDISLSKIVTSTGILQPRHNLKIISQ